MEFRDRYKRFRILWGLICFVRYRKGLLPNYYFSILWCLIEYWNFPGHTKQYIELRILGITIYGTNEWK